MPTLQIMWCTHCQREVTADFLPAVGEIRCAVCRQAMPGGLPEEPRIEADFPTTVVDAADRPLPLLDDSLMQDDLREARRLLGQQGKSHSGHTSQDAVEKRCTISLFRRLFSWAFIGTGVLLIAYGMGLFTATILLKRNDLWLWGGVAAFFGQFLLFTGYTARKPSDPATAQDETTTKPADAPQAELSDLPADPTPTGLPSWSARSQATLACSLVRHERAEVASS